MIKTIIVGLISAIVVLSVVSAAPAWKGGRGSGGWGMGSAYQRMYNPQTVETISGTVESVDKFTPMRGMGYGIHLMVKTDKGIIPVHLGPGWYIERQAMKFAKGDKVEVKGSRVTFNGKPAIIAQEVKKDDGTLILRDDTGTPEWAAWRKR